MSIHKPNIVNELVWCLNVTHSWQTWARFPSTPFQIRSPDNIRIKFRNLEKILCEKRQQHHDRWPIDWSFMQGHQVSVFSNSSIHNLYIYGERKNEENSIHHIWLYSLSLVGILWSAEIQSQVNILQSLEMSNYWFDSILDSILDSIEYMKMCRTLEYIPHLHLNRSAMLCTQTYTATTSTSTYSTWNLGCPCMTWSDAPCKTLIQNQIK